MWESKLGEFSSIDPLAHLSPLKHKRLKGALTLWRTNAGDLIVGVHLCQELDGKLGTVPGDIFSMVPLSVWVILSTNQSQTPGSSRTESRRSHICSSLDKLLPKPPKRRVSCARFQQRTHRSSKAPNKFVSPNIVIIRIHFALSSHQAPEFWQRFDHDLSLQLFLNAPISQAPRCVGLDLSSRGWSSEAGGGVGGGAEPS